MQVCRTCKRNVIMAEVGGRLTAFESEVVEAVPVTLRGTEGGYRVAGEVTAVRRVHAALCAGYVEQGRKERIAREQRDFNRRQASEKRRNHGL